MRALLQRSMHRLSRLFGWADPATATMAVAFYLLMSVAFGVLAGLTVRVAPVTIGSVRLALCVVLLVAHIVLHWFAYRLLSGKPERWARQAAYCVIQAGLIFAISLLTTSPVLTLGLWVTLVVETVALLWPAWKAMVLSAALYYGLMALNWAMIWGLQGAVSLIPAVALILGGLLLYALALAREYRSRQNAQEMVRQLEATQRQLEEYAEQVEELTISNERQRMAREMHDTLAQGLAGVIMQLEAADSHLESDRPAEARVLVEQAMLRARQTLHEARGAIQALRSAALEQRDLAAALAAEVSQFEVTSGVTADFVLEGEPAVIGPNVAQHLLRIVQESLSNIERHAQARHVQVRLVQSDSRIQLMVQDDGKGFDVEAAMLRAGCFGLQGMYERAQRLGATLRLKSAPLEGTMLVLSLEDVPKTELDLDQASMPVVVGGAAASKAMTE
jgi:two-component system, NarL family, sensor histidine kinase YdfH